MECIWCNEPQTKEDKKDCYWIMPDGLRSVLILQVPAIDCPNCHLYVCETVSQKVEENLYVKDLSSYPDVFTYEELLAAPTMNLFKIK